MSVKTISVVIIGLFLGFATTFFAGKYLAQNQLRQPGPLKTLTPLFEAKQQIVGFLPYWLVDKFNTNNIKYLTTLTYFGISIAPDGTLVKLAKPGEEEPGWYTLRSGKMDPIFSQAKSQNLKLSLLLFSGEQSAIDSLISDPASHAATLVSQAAPVMQEFGFTDLNLDIESVIDASPSSQEKMTAFVREVKKEVDQRQLGTLTIDSSPTDLIESRLINPAAVAPLVDSWVMMTYDFHYQGSSVTGPVGPVGGAGLDAEFDTESGIQKALAIMPPDKLLLGAPLYGYEWETVGSVPRSAVIPATGATASNLRMEKFMASCATCSAQVDQEAMESYVIYHDEETNTFHQVFFPDANSTAAKINLVNKYHLNGLAFWALGYEGENILGPLGNYKSSIEP